jgi:hypothetical protein
MIATSRANKADLNAELRRRVLVEMRRRDPKEYREAVKADCVALAALAKRT